MVAAMIIELGHFTLILALALAALQATIPLAGALGQRPAWMALALPLPSCRPPPWRFPSRR